MFFRFSTLNYCFTFRLEVTGRFPNFVEAQLKGYSEDNMRWFPTSKDGLEWFKNFNEKQ